MGEALSPSSVCGTSSRPEENWRELYARRFATHLGFAYRPRGTARHAEAKPQRSRPRFCPASPGRGLLAQTLAALDVQSRERRHPLLSASLPVFGRLCSLSSGSHVRSLCQTVPTISRHRRGGLTLCTQRWAPATLAQRGDCGTQLRARDGWDPQSGPHCVPPGAAQRHPRDHLRSGSAANVPSARGTTRVCPAGSRSRCG